MNLVEVYVTNITQHTEVEGIHFIKADFDCYGRKELEKEKWLTDCDWRLVVEKGYYLAQYNKIKI